MRGVATIGVLEEIAIVMAATSSGVAGIWVERVVKGVMFWRFRVTASWERARALRSLIPSWCALCFASCVVNIGDPFPPQMLSAHSLVFPTPLTRYLDDLLF